MEFQEFQTAQLASPAVLDTIVPTLQEVLEPPEVRYSNIHTLTKVESNYFLRRNVHGREFLTWAPGVHAAITIMIAKPALHQNVPKSCGTSCQHGWNSRIKLQI